MVKTEMKYDCIPDLGSMESTWPLKQILDAY